MLGAHSSRHLCRGLQEGSSWSARTGPAPWWAGLASVSEAQASHHTPCHSGPSHSLLGTTWPVRPSSVAQTQDACPVSSTVKPNFVRRCGCVIGNRCSTPKCPFLSLSGSLGFCDNPAGQCQADGARAQTALRGEALPSGSPNHTAHVLTPGLCDPKQVP